MSEKFHERFAIPIGLDKAQAHFTNRIHNRMWSKFWFERLNGTIQSEANLAVYDALGIRNPNKHIYAFLGNDLHEHL